MINKPPLMNLREVSFSKEDQEQRKVKSDIDVKMENEVQLQKPN